MSGGVSVWVRLDVTGLKDTVPRFIWRPKSEVYAVGVAICRALFIEFPVTDDRPARPCGLDRGAGIDIRPACPTEWPPVEIFVPTGADAVEPSGSAMWKC